MAVDRAGDWVVEAILDDRVVHQSKIPVTARAVPNPL
jgi:hypothetical protein